MISLRIDGGNVLMKALSRLSEPDHRKDLMTLIGEIGVDSTKKRFLNEQAPDGKEWKPSRRGAAEGHTLRDSLELYNRFAYEATPDSVAWGTNVIYAAIHQFGGTRPPKNAQALAFQGFNGAVVTKKVTMPARPFLGVNDADRNKIDVAVQNWMKGAFA